MMIRFVDLVCEIAKFLTLLQSPKEMFGLLFSLPFPPFFSSPHPTPHPHQKSHVDGRPPNPSTPRPSPNSHPIIIHPTTTTRLISNTISKSTNPPCRRQTPSHKGQMDKTRNQRPHQRLWHPWRRKMEKVSSPPP